jgi:hypothetical protein
MTSPVLDAGDDLPLTLPGVWRRHVQRRPDEIRLANEGGQLSYAEVDQRRVTVGPAAPTSHSASGGRTP